MQCLNETKTNTTIKLKTVETAGRCVCEHRRTRPAVLFLQWSSCFTQSSSEELTFCHVRVTDSLRVIKHEDAARCFFKLRVFAQKRSCGYDKYSECSEKLQLQGFKLGDKQLCRADAVNA